MSNRHTRARLSLCLASFFSGMVFYAPIATYYRQARGVDILGISVIESISLVFGLLMEVPWGYFADRIGYRKTLVVSSFVLFSSRIVFWRAYSFPVFLAERLLLSFANAAMSGVDNAYLSKIDNRQASYGLYQASGMAGLVAASLLFPLLSSPVDESGLFTVFSGFLSLVCMLTLPEVESVDTKGRRTMHVPRWDKKTWFFLTSVALFSAVNQMVTVFLVQMGYERMGLPLSSFAYPYLGLSCLSVAGGWWSAWWYHLKKASIWCFVCSLAGVLCLVLGKSLPPLIIGVLSVRLGFCLFMPYVAKRQVSGSETYDQATALSIQQMYFDLVEIVISPILGWLASRDLNASFLVSFCLLAAAWLLFIRQEP